MASSRDSALCQRNCFFSASSSCESDRRLALLKGFLSGHGAAVPARMARSEVPSFDRCPFAARQTAIPASDAVCSSRPGRKPAKRRH
jgi:hypothetical protein